MKLKQGEGGSMELSDVLPRCLAGKTFELFDEVALVVITVIESQFLPRTAGVLVYPLFNSVEAAYPQVRFRAHSHALFKMPF